MNECKDMTQLRNICIEGQLVDEVQIGLIVARCIAGFREFFLGVKQLYE
jgi:hypothetical protein